MKILIIGGTVFLGRHLTEAALARGHKVTLFNRGQHNPELFPEVEKLRGNRDGEMDALKVERDALQDEVTRLRGLTGQQAARIQQLERTLVILQSRLGITAGR